MTDTLIQYGPWHIQNGFERPTNSVTLFQDYQPSERISLFLTQTKLTSYQQKKNIEEWRQKLPELKEVKFLWLPSKVNQKIFDSICEMTNLEGLWIKWSGIKNIDGLVKLKKLKHFHLGSSSQVQSIDILEIMKCLETLELEQLNLITDFSALKYLINLKGLGIDGSMWTAQKIESLKPIGQLYQLQYLTTTNTQILDKSFDPLLNLTELVRFNSS